MKVKDLMIPVGEYKMVGKDATLADVANVLNESGHRDVFVVDDNGDLEGVLTMTDILVALEPNYKKLNNNDLDTDVLSRRYVADLFKEYNLWGDSLHEICKRGISIKAGEAMHIPAKGEYLNEDDNIDQAMHRYIVGAHQPIFVRANGTITGVIRLNDVFNEVKNRMLACVSEL